MLVAFVHVTAPPPHSPVGDLADAGPDRPGSGEAEGGGDAAGEGAIVPDEAVSCACLPVHPLRKPPTSLSLGGAPATAITI